MIHCDMLTEMIHVILKNGLYLLYVYAALLIATNHLFLSTVVVLKLFPVNFFYWFYDSFNYFGEPYKHWNQLKQFVLFSDSGHIIAFLYLFDSQYLPMAFNIHWLITVGYWYGKWVMKMSDCSKHVQDNVFIPWYTQLWTHMNHSIHICLLFREIVLLDKSMCYDYFGWNDLFHTYLWMYGWFFCIYLPWRLITTDIVYDFFDENQIAYIGAIHVCVFVGNIVGKCLMYIL